MAQHTSRTGNPEHSYGSLASNFLPKAATLYIWHTDRKHENYRYGYAFNKASKSTASGCEAVHWLVRLTDRLMLR